MKGAETMVRTPEELYEWSGEHLAYEVQMFLAGAGYLPLVEPDRLVRIDGQPLDPGSRRFYHNARLEAVLVSARSLIEFLYADASPRHPEDVRASEFIDGTKSVPELIGERTARLERLQLRAHKELAHLTDRRLSGTPPEKDYDGFAFDELFVRLEAFVNVALRTHLSPNVAAEIAKAPRRPKAGLQVPVADNLPNYARRLWRLTLVGGPNGSNRPIRTDE